MRTTLLVALVLLAALPLQAGGRDGGASVDVIVPLDPQEHQRLRYFGRRDHHLVPGTVTINRSPYVCDIDGKRFRERDEFVGHLRASHETPAHAIPDRLFVRDGVVHFLKE